MTLMDQGMRQAEIAREFNVSRQYVNRLAIAGGHSPVSTEVTENLPWSVDPEWYTNTIYQGLRLLGHYQLDPEGLVGSSRVKLRGFLRKLDTFNQVVDYDPSYPAIKGISNTPGFAYVPRRPEDNGLVIKNKPGIKITNTGKRIWRIPDEWP